MKQSIRVLWSIIFTIVLFQSPCLSEMDWEIVKDVMRNGYKTIVYDEIDSNIITRFSNHETGAQETWVLNSGVWSNMSYDNLNNYEAKLFFSSLRDKVSAVVPFEGKLLVWDGQSWEVECVFDEGNPLTLPYLEIAYDTVRNKLVLFGAKEKNGNSVPETWEWDGETWEKLFPVTKPKAQGNHSMVFFEKEGKVMLIGEEQDNQHAPHEANLYYWDGIDWEHIIPASGEIGDREYFGITYDSTREVVITSGGWGYLRPDSPEGVFLGTFEWDGEDWIEIETSFDPGLSNPGLAFNKDINKTVCFSGSDGFYRNRTFLYDGSDWEEIAFEQHFPFVPESGFEMAYNTDTNTTFLCYGGYDVKEFWNWDGINWSRIFLEGDDYPIKNYGGMAYHASRHEFVLFTGESGGYYVNNTWTFDGNSWTLKNPARKPEPRAYLQLSYDSHRDRVVMFGGVNTDAYPSKCYDDTYEWDGTNWYRLDPPVHPPRTASYAMTYDSHRQVTVMYGGVVQVPTEDPYVVENRESNETWEWNGDTWVQRFHEIHPGLSINDRMAYDCLRRRCVMFVGMRRQTWEWDGADWHQMDPVSNEPGNEPRQSGYGLVYDTSRQTIFMQRSAEIAENCHKTWSYHHTDPDICMELGLTLTLPQLQYTPGDSFFCNASICNNTGQILTGYAVFVLLDVYGDYFWGPGWTPDFDGYWNELPLLQEGITDYTIIPEFTWPTGAGTATGIGFIGCITDPEIQIPYGNVAMVEFGWSE